MIKISLIAGCDVFVKTDAHKLKWIGIRTIAAPTQIKWTLIHKELYNELVVMQSGYTELTGKEGDDNAQKSSQQPPARKGNQSSIEEKTAESVV